MTLSASAGVGTTGWAVSLDLVLAVLTDTPEINTRLTSLETKTQNLAAAAALGTIVGILKAVKRGNQVLAVPMSVVAAVLVSAGFARRHHLDMTVSIAAQAMTTDTPDTFAAHDMMQLVGYGMTQAAARQVYAAAGIGPGDKVVTVANTVTATVSAIGATGALPLFVDIEPATMLMDLDALESAAIVALALRRGVPLVKGFSTPCCWCRASCLAGWFYQARWPTPQPIPIPLCYSTDTIGGCGCSRCSSQEHLWLLVAQV